MYQIGFQLQNWFIYAILTWQKVLDCSVTAISVLLFKIRDYQCWLKNMYNLRIVLSFVWGKMRTAAQEAASQIALRDCSKVSVGESQYIRFWWRESSVPWSIHFTKGFLLAMRIWCHHEGICASLDMRRCKDWDHKVCS